LIVVEPRAGATGNDVTIAVVLQNRRLKHPIEHVRKLYALQSSFHSRFSHDTRESICKQMTVWPAYKRSRYATWKWDNRFFIRNIGLSHLIHGVNGLRQARSPATITRSPKMVTNNLFNMTQQKSIQRAQTSAKAECNPNHNETLSGLSPKSKSDLKI